MTIPNASDLAKIRTHPQNTKLYLSVYQPSTVFAAQVNDGSITKGARVITYDNVTEGSRFRISNGLVMYVGSTPGAYDKGTVRCRSADATTVTVAENSDINWANDDYITVIRYVEIVPVFPRIYTNPSDQSDQTWYKDYDVAYTNQNSTLGSFICMGSHYAGFSGKDVYYSASGTTNVNDEALTYYWFFEGATVTGSFDHTPGYRTYNTPGHYFTRLIVSGSSSQSSDVSYRYVSIYDRPGSGISVPILNWELVDLSGDREQGGYTSKIRIRQSVPDTLIRGGSLIIIFSEDWYGDLATPYYIGGNSLNRGNIFFVGYVMGDTISYNYRTSQVEFEVGSPTEVMKIAEGFGVAVENSTDPDNILVTDPLATSPWAYVKNMNFKRALYHYLRWHTTVLYCTDIEFIGTDKDLESYTTDVGSIYDALQNEVGGGWVGRVCSDRQGKTWIERDVWIEPTAFQTNFTLSKQDWINDPRIEEVLTRQVSFLEVGGTAYDNEAMTYEPLLANAPGASFSTRGKIERIQGIALDSQADLNAITGAMFAQKNSKYPSIDLNLAGMYKCFDIAPQEKIPMTLESTDTHRGISFSGKNFYIRSLQYDWKPDNESLLPRLTLGEIASGPDADTIPIPVLPVEEDNQINVPPIRFPAIPVISVGGGSSINFVPVETGQTDIDNGGFTRMYPDGVSDDGFDIATMGGIVFNSYDNRGVTEVDTIANATCRISAAGSYTFTPVFETFLSGSGVPGNMTTSAWFGVPDNTTALDSSTNTADGNYTTSGQGYIIQFTSSAITLTLSAGAIVGLSIRRISSAAQGDTYLEALNFLGWIIT